ncbi:class I SAM-dependent methyltransferase [Goodfellowiella coeruleoviolacea]|uniref:2-polyprenyl-3-methyl-5-hydroxy-6-metoxy-1, 4-benzoquinol methylase n=1 Tax=Goodfellowiella coeruleoviolacea TaxID=334858 RepID=A0AAE3GLF1_9PSEU|nr:class I SAM-dependent methyltransferase [Goodfellowiella coeruleoviolacea]MCP2169559.1 2-polyprenyl-3-methyl-5-hydroxy-6-metoxy-1,4-benzoquinol methylase [Goodfellowiella coeruleoviolacea]
MRPDAVHQVLDAELTAARERRGGTSPQVLDVGGGSGGWAVPLAVAGCSVLVIEPSPNALATLQRRVAEAGVGDRVTAVQGDTDALAELAPRGGADLVLGHGVLEVVDDAAAAVSALAAALAPGGALSILVANRYAAVLQRAVAGRLADARRLLADAAGVGADTGEALLRRFDVAGLSDLVGRAGLTVELVQGHGVLADLVPGSVLEATPGATEALAELELAAARQPPLRDIAARLHVLARRP